MHLLVLSAFRLGRRPDIAPPAKRVSMHLLVLSAFRQEDGKQYVTVRFGSQCTFWCSVLSDASTRGRAGDFHVSMHLLVLSAFRPHN